MKLKINLSDAQKEALQAKLLERQRIAHEQAVAHARRCVIEAKRRMCRGRASTGNVDGKYIVPKGAGAR